MTTQILKSKLDQSDIKSLKDLDNITIHIEDNRYSYEKFKDKISKGKFIYYNKELLYIEEILSYSPSISKDIVLVGKSALFPETTAEISNPEVLETISLSCYVVDITFSIPYFYKSRRKIIIHKGRYRDDEGSLDKHEDSSLRDTVNRIYSTDSSELERDNFTYESYRNGVKRIINLI